MRAAWNVDVDLYAEMKSVEAESEAAAHHSFVLGKMCWDRGRGGIYNWAGLILQLCIQNTEYVFIIIPVFFFYNSYQK